MTKRRGYIRIKAYSYLRHIPSRIRRRRIRVKGHWRKKPKKPRYEKVKAVLNIHYNEQNYSLIIISYIRTKYLKTSKQRIAVRERLIKRGVRRIEKNPGLYKLYRKADVEVALKDRPEGLQRTRYVGKKRGTRIYLQDYQRDEEREL